MEYKVGDAVKLINAEHDITGLIKQVDVKFNQVYIEFEDGRKRYYHIRNIKFARKEQIERLLKVL
jgi:hypothetical protein